ncbi:unnamed protein product [Candidula unifasciata]|uniref:Sushi domain-containing protein n=1 Tax=Candidula unifasciata TaxID=100452 RepID=A0A8S3ZTX7_9EUPU|nr:unnamed protein product [Candidula unifasciata]
MNTQTGSCKALATKLTILTEGNIATLKLSNYDTSNGTVVVISCYTPSYQVQGNSRVTCVNGSWQPAPPDPDCVPKPSVTPTTPAYNNTQPNSAQPALGPYDTVVIITSCMLAVIVIFLLALLLYKCCTCRSKPSSNTYELPRSTTSTLPLFTTQTGSHVLQSSFPGSQRSWTYLSVDRLIRDIETSRKENPNHNWRDFASISSYSTKRL